MTWSNTNPAQLQESSKVNADQAKCTTFFNSKEVALLVIDLIKTNHQQSTRQIKVLLQCLSCWLPCCHNFKLSWKSTRAPSLHCKWWAKAQAIYSMLVLSIEWSILPCCTTLRWSFEWFRRINQMTNLVQMNLLIKINHWLIRIKGQSKHQKRHFDHPSKSFSLNSNLTSKHNH